MNLTALHIYNEEGNEKDMCTHTYTGEKKKRELYRDRASKKTTAPSPSPVLFGHGALPQ